MKLPRWLSHIALPLLISMFFFICGYFYNSFGVTGNDIGRGILFSLLSFFFTLNMQFIQKTYFHIKRSDVEKVIRLKSQIKGELSHIFEDYWDSTLENIRNLIEKPNMVIYDREDFKSFYKRILAVYPQTKFFASALLDKKYFWDTELKPGSVEEATQLFIKKGGKFERTFLVNSSDEERIKRGGTVLDLQVAIGVKTYYFNIDNDQSNLNHEAFYLVSEKKNIAWKVFANHFREIVRIEITVDNKEIKKIRNYFKRLQSLNRIEHKISIPQRMNEIVSR